MRLLIVEDDAPLASGLRRILEAEGHAVDVTSRGEQAVLAAAQERFDLVILDIGLPQMDGFEVLRRLRAGSPDKNGPMPVLVLTARDAIDDRVRGLDLGADDYMVKPFAMPELTARVRALLRRSQAHGGPRILRAHLLRMLLPPIAALLVLGALVAYYPSIEPSTAAYDQGLIAVGISLGSYIRAAGTGYRLELPAQVDQVLRRDSFDTVYYRVLGPGGQVIAGDDGLPEPQSGNVDT